MARSKKPRSLLDKDGPVLQLSSQERILAISAILLWGAFCFVLGILATNVDRYLKERRQATAEQVEEREESSEAAAASPAPEKSAPSNLAQSGEGRVTSPRQGMLPSSKPSTSSSSRTQPPAPKPTATDRGKTVPDIRLPVKVPAPDPDETSAKPTGEEGKPEQTKPAVTTEELADVSARKGTSHSDPEPPAPKPAKDEAKPKPAAIKPLEPVEPKQPEANPPAKQETPDAKAPSSTPSEQPRGPSPAELKPPPAAPRERFGVQVASFTATNAARAEAYRKEVAADTALPATLVKSEDGKHVRVVVGSYATKGAAAEARDKLRKRKEYAGCYVQTIR